jgi:hypothetical protein
MIFSSEIQIRAYDGKGYHKNSSGTKRGKDKSKEAYIAASCRLTQ